MESVPSGGIKFECLPQERAMDRVNFLGAPAPPIKISDWRSQRIKPLLKPAVETFARLFPQIADEVSSHHCLYVG
jgi:hypothetical protein